MNKKIIKSIIALGLSFVFAMLLVKPIGVSTEYSVSSGIIQNIIQKDTVIKKKNGDIYTKNAYYAKDDNKIAKAIENPVTYGMIFVLSIPFGALLGKILLKSKNNSDQSNKLTNTNLFNNPLILFMGGFLLLFGARWAGGCTSGHMMSGILQTSMSGIIFALVVFVVAIITSLILYKGKRR